jgi:hypothetical protein
MNNALLREKLRDEHQAHVLDAHLKTQDGTYGFMGSIADPSLGSTIPKAMSHTASRAEMMQRVRDRMAAGEPVKSLFFDESTETELLSEEDVDAYEEGWICPNCIQYQAVPSSTCNWRFKGERPSDPKDWGCGYRRDLF